MTADGTGLVEKLLEEEAMEEGGQTQRRAVLDLPEVRQQLDKLNINITLQYQYLYITISQYCKVRQQLDRLHGMKNNKAFLGLHDLVDWAVGQVRS